MDSDTEISSSPYLEDNRYVDNREASSLINAAALIIDDYMSLCEYIEPVNKNTYSHRTYELLLRVATEFEANCKGILEANGYNVSCHVDIKDYCKLNQVMLLDQYKIKTSLWSLEQTLMPLSEWSTGHSLTWYNFYNDSKHNRFSNFDKASFENVFKGICSLVVLLAAQFPFMVGRISGRSNLIFTTDEPNTLLTSDFSIEFPTRQDSQKYSFDWNTLKCDALPFDKYQCS